MQDKLPSQFETKNKRAGLFGIITRIQFDCFCFFNGNISNGLIDSSCSFWIYYCRNNISRLVYRNIYSYFGIFIKVIFKTRKPSNSSTIKSTSNTYAITFSSISTGCIAFVTIWIRVAIRISLVALTASNTLVIYSIISVCTIATSSSAGASFKNCFWLWWCRSSNNRSNRLFGYRLNCFCNFFNRFW